MANISKSLTALAAEALANHPEAEAVLVTQDGNVFLEKVRGLAEHHCRTQKLSPPERVTRAEAGLEDIKAKVVDAIKEVVKASAEHFGIVEALGSGSFPAEIPMGRGEEKVQLGTVVARAHKDSTLSVEEWNALPQGKRDIHIANAIKAMRKEAKAK